MFVKLKIGAVGASARRHSAPASVTVGRVRSRCRGVSLRRRVLGIERFEIRVAIVCKFKKCGPLPCCYVRRILCRTQPSGGCSAGNLSDDGGCIVTVILPERLTGAPYTEFLSENLPDFLEEIPLINRNKIMKLAVRDYFDQELASLSLLVT